MPRAAVLHQVGQPLEVADVELDGPRSGEIEVSIAASGICHSDLSVRDGVMGVPLPVVPGHEGAGIVTAVGSDVEGVTEGDHVVLSWVPSCGTCAWCQRGEPYLCSVGQAAADAGSLLDGTTRLRLHGDHVHQMSTLGTFAERSVVPAQAAVRIGPGVPLELAALIGCGVLTGVGAATRTASIDPGDTVAVFGCGGVGLNVIQGSVLAGASRVVAIDMNPAKLGLATRFGATDAVDASDVDAVHGLDELTAGDGVDVAFEVIGLEATIRQALRTTRRGGQTILIGIPDRDVRLSTRALGLVHGAKTIRGCWYGSSMPHRDVPRLLQLHGDGKLELQALISGELGLDDVNRGLDDLAAGSSTRSVIRFAH